MSETFWLILIIGGAILIIGFSIFLIFTFWPVRSHSQESTFLTTPSLTATKVAPSSFHKETTSSYKIKIERNNNQTSFIINDIRYSSIKEIPDAFFQKKAQELFSKMPSLPFKDSIISQKLFSELSISSPQIQVHNQEIKIEQMNNQERFIVNGITYHHLNEIPNPEVRAKIECLMKTGFNSL